MKLLIFCLRNYWALPSRSGSRDDNSNKTKNIESLLLSQKNSQPAQRSFHQIYEMRKLKFFNLEKRRAKGQTDSY